MNSEKDVFNRIEATQTAELPDVSAGNQRDGRVLEDYRFFLQNPQSSLVSDNLRILGLLGGAGSFASSDQNAAGLPFNGLLLNGAGGYKRSLTVTSTTFSVSTVTSTFACSVASGFGQCPIINGRR